MIRINLFLLLIIILFSNYLRGQDSPKNIIIIEEELSTIAEEELATQEEKNLLNSNKKPIINKNKKYQIQKNDNVIVVDDIEKEFNEWYGVLPSEEGGFGWRMWGDTSKEYALSLLRKTNFKTRSTILKELTINFLLSRANAPKLEKIEKNQYNLDKEKDPFIYFKEKIKILSEIGAVESIDKLINSIPLELKGDSFREDISELRKQSINIPSICNNTLDKKFNSNQNLEKRKSLIACNIALKKFNQAQLSIDLLENDSVESLPYITLAREMIESPNIKSITNFSSETNDNINVKIMSLVDYNIAKFFFINETIVLDKLIYEMNLYEKEDQIQALERLVEQGVYNLQVLEKAYISFYNYIQDNSIKVSLNNLEEENSLIIRVKLYNLTNNSISNLERARYLNLLWLKAAQIGTEKSVYKLTSNIISSIKQEPELSWFIYPATKALIVSNQLDQARSWLFFLSEDLYNRASLDIKFCKYLILLYLKDNNSNNIGNNIPEIDFLIKRFANSLDINKIELLRILISLKSVGYEVDDNYWKSFYIDDVLNGKPSNINFQLDNLYFNLDIAVKNKNIAETVLISLNILNNRDKENFNYYELIKPLDALFELGLKKYVRDYVLELNLDSFN